MDQNERDDMIKTKEECTRDFLKMTPDAIDFLWDIIRDPSINPIARVQAISLVMDRGLGKPVENIKIQHMEAERDEAQQRMDELFEEVRRKERGGE